MRGRIVDPPQMWAGFGLAVGYSAAIRPTNATLLVGLALAIVITPLAREKIEEMVETARGIRRRIRDSRDLALATSMPSILGGALRSGYAWWVKEVYGCRRHRLLDPLICSGRRCREIRTATF